MFKLLLTLLPFFKEVIFGKKEEHVNDSLTTKTKKWIFLVIVVVSLSSNYFMGKRLYAVSLHHVKTLKQLEAVKATEAELAKTKEQVVSLEKYLRMCFKGEEYRGLIK